MDTWLDVFFVGFSCLSPVLVCVGLIFYELPAFPTLRMVISKRFLSAIQENLSEFENKLICILGLVCVVYCSIFLYAKGPSSLGWQVVVFVPVLLSFLWLCGLVFNLAYEFFEERDEPDRFGWSC